ARSGDTRRGPFGREMPPVETSVVGHEDAVLERASKIGRHVLEPGSAHDVTLAETGEAGHPNGNGAARVEHGLVRQMHGSVLEDRHRYIDDPPAPLRPGTGRLDVDDRKAAPRQLDSPAVRDHRAGAAGSYSVVHRHLGPTRCPPS